MADDQPKAVDAVVEKEEDAREQEVELPSEKEEDLIEQKKRFGGVFFFSFFFFFSLFSRRKNLLLFVFSSPNFLLFLFSFFISFLIILFSLFLCILRSDVPEELDDIDPQPAIYLSPKVCFFEPFPFSSLNNLIFFCLK